VSVERKRLNHQGTKDGALQVNGNIKS